MWQLILIVLTAANTILIALSQVALWQRKEYRIDRMRAYIYSPEGTLRTQKFLVASVVLVVLAWITTSNFLATLSLVSIFIGHIVRVYKRGIIRPDFTSRAILTLICTAILAVVWVVWFVQNSELFALHLATFVVFLPSIIAVSVGIITVPSELQKQRVISRARAYRTQLKSLTVIGITGSVGKTSTKTYLTHLLGGESGTVVATAKHRNSPYSVAEDMLFRLSQKTLVYIAEMGAYIPGEIKELAELTKPTIAIITSITNQHVGLFGSLEALAKTKWELVASLPENGTAILNKDNDTIVQKAKESTIPIIWFSTNTQADVFATNITVHRDHTRCTISSMNEKRDVVLPVISRGQLTSILAAVAAAHARSVDFSTICERLATLPIIERTMELRRGKSQATIIDDSYSASEASVINAIEYLGHIDASDIRLVLVPIIELGDEGSAVHERIGKHLAQLPARVFIYGDEYKEDITRGLGNNPQAKIAWFRDARDLTDHVLENSTEKTVLLLEGRIPSLTRNSLL